MRNLIRRIAVDTSALSESRDFRLLTLGSVVTGFGTQAALVALPYQVYVTTRSAFLTGLLGLVELGPLIALSLFGGALADRFDRRRLLLLTQIALVAVALGLAATALDHKPPLWLLYVLAAASAAASAVERVSRSAIVPNVVPPERLRGALSLTFGLMQLTMVVGPAAGGLLIAAAGVQGAYVADAVSCAGMVAAAAAMAPQPPRGGPDAGEEREPIFRSIATGLRFVRGERALVGSFVIDLCAMTFGMPRALFPVLALTVYHAGAAGTGALFAAVAAGATVAALTTGWLEHARWLGRIVLAAVAVWGLAIALAGVTTSIAIACVLLALAGAADSVSAVCRSTISQTLTPDRLRGRMSSVFSLVVASGPRLGDVESGAIASVATPRVSVVSGGVACIASVGAIAVLFPALARYDGRKGHRARMTHHGIEAVVFDLDGILVQSEELWDEARRALVADAGIEWPDGATGAMMGMSSKEWSRYVHEEIGLDMPPADINTAVVERLEARYRSDLPWIAGALAAVRRMAASFPLGLATSSNREIVDIVIEEGGLGELIGVTVSSEEVERGKPAPDVYLEATRRMGVDPGRAAAIEDSTNGLLAAAAAGMRVVAIPNDAHPPAPEGLAAAHAVLGSIEDLEPGVVQG